MFQPQRIEDILMVFRGTETPSEGSIFGLAFPLITMRWLKSTEKG